MSRDTTYEERAERWEIINPEASWWDNEPQALEAFPLILDVAPGETVETGYSNDYRTAPPSPGTYELWHYVLGGSHHSFEWRKADV